jgi:predicted dithiol-disulfide oxidoreductase (DUF899 family)
MAMTSHKIVSREEWLAARAASLKREKDHTRKGDELAQQRRELIDHEDGAIDEGWRIR